MPCWIFFIYKGKKTGLEFNKHEEKKTPHEVEGFVSFVGFFALWGCLGICKVFIVSKSVLPSSNWLVQAKEEQKKPKNKCTQEKGQHMGFSSLPKVGASSLPVVLLFGKMNGERRQQERAAGICTDDLRRGKRML